jgi:hypothetical protein
MASAPLPDFLGRVLARLAPPASAAGGYAFQSWSVAGKATAEALGVLPVPGVDPERFLTRVMDVDGYRERIPHVVESRAVADPRFPPPEKVRFYQRVNIPVLGDVHQENVLERAGEHGGWRVAVWHLLEEETGKLSPRTAIRSQYSDGAWLVAPGIVAYALSSAPRREDVGFLKWKALTAGADVAASRVIRENIAAMARWAAAAG